MLKNATLDANIHEDFAKIWRNFDKIFINFRQIFLKFPHLAGSSGHGRRHAEGGHRAERGLHRVHDTSVFPRLVLGWIEADFRVQIRIFQNLQEYHLLASKFGKFLPKIGKFCKIFDIFWQILQNFAKFSEIRIILTKFCRFFSEFYRNV